MSLPHRAPRSIPAKGRRAGPGPLRVLTACVLLISNLTACTSWQAQPLEPSPTPTEPRRLRVTLTDGSVRTLYDAQISGDSVIGYWGRADSRNRQAGRVSVHLSEVESVEAHETDKVRSAIFIGALTAGIVYYIVAWINFEPTN